MNSAMIHLLTHTSNSAYMDSWPKGVAVLCAACSWFQHNVGWPGATFGTGSGIFNFSGNPYPDRPPDFPRWSRNDQDNWRDAHPYMPSMWDWVSIMMSLSVKYTTGTSETTKANGCTKA